MRDGEIKFKRKNIISCNGVPMRSIIWNYICWVLAGRPNETKVKWPK